MLRLMSFSPSNFTRYVSQTESIPDEAVNVNEWTHGSPPTMTDLPSLLSFSAVPAADLPDDALIKPTAINSSIVTEDIESIPYLHHGPGPIQRPNKLHHSSAPTNVTPHSLNSLQSPGTSDVLDHLNRFIYNNSEGRVAATATNNVNANAVASPMINDLTPSNLPWGFSSTEWSSKLESSWPLSSLQSPNLSLASPMENPFTMIPQAPRADSSLWSSAAVGTSPSQFASSAARTQRASGWNDFFSSTASSSTATEPAKINANPWAKYMAAPDPSSNNPFWALSSLATDSVVPTSPPIQQPSASPIWWTGLSSDENNNTNHRNGDQSNARDQSRWDFAR